MSNKIHRKVKGSNSANNAYRLFFCKGESLLSTWHTIRWYHLAIESLRFLCSKLKRRSCTIYLYICSLQRLSGLHGNDSSSFFSTGDKLLAYTFKNYTSVIGSH